MNINIWHASFNYIADVITVRYKKNNAFSGTLFATVVALLSIGIMNKRLF